jgi:hypothetical protein
MAPKAIRAVSHNAAAASSRNCDTVLVSFGHVRYLPISQSAKVRGLLLMKSLGARAARGQIRPSLSVNST